MRIGRYEVLGEIARGGFGVVMRGRDAALGRDVAIKILLSAGRLGEVQRKRFEREVNALARLRHPNIVSVHEAGTSAQGPYVVMDLVEGQSLEDRLNRDGPLPLREALRIMEVVTAAIGHAHEQGILHRDLKPANILIDRLGNPFVTDFGLARDVDPRFSAEALSRTGASIGTPGFWPPEQAFGQLEKMGPRCDVYSIGATLYALLTGQAPYEGDNVIEILGLMASAPRPASTLRPGLPAAVDQVLARALAHEPEDRWSSVAELGTALTDARRHAVGSKTSRAIGGGREAGAGGARRVVVAGSALAIVAAVGAALVARGVSPERADPGPATAAVTTTGPAPVPAPAPGAVVTPTEVPPDDATAEREAMIVDAVTRTEAALAAGALDDAVRALTPAFERFSPDHRLLLLRARLCLEGQEPQVAASDASLVLQDRPDDIAALLIRGKARRRLNEPADVLVDAAHVLELQPENAKALGLRAWARSKLGDVDGAFEDWTAAIKLEPSADLLVDSGNLAFERGHLEIAEKDFTLALQLDPEHAPALLNRAAVFTKRDQAERALEDLERAVDIRPNSMTWLRLGDHRRLHGDLPGAIRDLTRAIELDPDSSEAHRLRGSARLSADDFPGAIGDLTRAIELGARTAETHTLLGIATRRSGDLEGGLRHLADALAIDPDHASAHHQRAMIHDDRAELDLALAAYDRSIALRPNFVDAMYNRALLLVRRRDNAAARTAFDQVLALEPDHAECLLTRGDLRRRTNDLDGAVADTTRAVELEPDLAEAQLAAALALHAKGGLENLRRAEHLFSSYLAGVPSNGRIMVERARCRESLGDRAGAKADYQRTLELVPEGPDNVRSFATGRLNALKRLEELERTSDRAPGATPEPAPPP